MTAVPAATAGRALGWHILPHLAMVAVMLIVMTAAADVMGHLAGALALLALSVAIAPVARRRHELSAVLLDLTGMGAVLVALATAGSAHHAHGSSALPVLGIIAVLWLAARAAATRGRLAVMTGVLCGAQLGVMIVLAAV